MLQRIIITISCALVLLGCPVTEPSDSGVDPGDSGAELPDAAELLDAPTSDTDMPPDAAMLDVITLDAGPPDTACNCDDGIACTIDSCASGRCTNTVDHTRCMGGQLCERFVGCTTGAPCMFEFECPVVGTCFRAECRSNMCAYLARDADRDGFGDARCGGDDCNDLNGSTYPGADESCDGIDQDCASDGDPVDASGCDSSATCIGGRCVCDAAATTVCGGLRCVDLRTDERACGRCGRTCEGSCVAGECTCASGRTACEVASNVECADTRASVTHCGACGRACLEGARCTASVCSVALDTPWRVYGVAGDTFSSRITEVRRDPTSRRSAVGIFANGNFYSYPRVGPRLFFADGGIVTNAPDGTFAHYFRDESLGVNGFDIAGNVLWVLAPSGTIGGVTTTAACTLIRFDATTGASIGQRTLPVDCRNTRIARDGLGVALFTYGFDNADFGGGPMPRADSMIVRYAADGSFVSALPQALPFSSSSVFVRTPTGFVLTGVSPRLGITLAGTMFRRDALLVVRTSDTGAVRNAFEARYSTNLFADDEHVLSCGTSFSVASCQLFEFVGTSAFEIFNREMAATMGVFEGGSLWTSAGNDLTRINPLTGVVVDRVGLGATARSILASGAGRLDAVLQTERPFTAQGVTIPAAIGYATGQLTYVP